MLAGYKVSTLAGTKRKLKLFTLAQKYKIIVEIDIIEYRAIQQSGYGKVCGAEKYHINVDEEQLKDFTKFRSTTIRISVQKIKRLWL